MRANFAAPGVRKRAMTGCTWRRALPPTRARKRIIACPCAPPKSAGLRDRPRRRQRRRQYGLRCNRRRRRLPPWSRDLKKHAGASLVVIRASTSRPPCMPWRMPSTRRWEISARRWSTPNRLKPSPVDQWPRCGELIGDMDAGAVEMLLILGANPVYNAPADLPFAEKFNKVKLRDPPRALRRRDVRALPLAHPRNALPRNLGRCARL